MRMSAKHHTIIMRQYFIPFRNRWFRNDISSLGARDTRVSRCTICVTFLRQQKYDSTASRRRYSTPRRPVDRVYIAYIATISGACRKESFPLTDDQGFACDRSATDGSRRGESSRRFRATPIGWCFLILMTPCIVIFFPILTISENRPFSFHDGDKYSASLNNTFDFWSLQWLFYAHHHLKSQRSRAQNSVETVRLR